MLYSGNITELNTGINAPDHYILMSPLSSLSILGGFLNQTLRAAHDPCSSSCFNYQSFANL